MQTAQQQERIIINSQGTRRLNICLNSKRFRAKVKRLRSTFRFNLSFSLNKNRVNFCNLLYSYIPPTLLLASGTGVFISILSYNKYLIKSLIIYYLSNILYSLSLLYLLAILFIFSIGCMLSLLILLPRIHPTTLNNKPQNIIPIYSTTLQILFFSPSIPLIPGRSLEVPSLSFKPLEPFKFLNIAPQNYIFIIKNL